MRKNLIPSPEDVTIDNPLAHNYVNRVFVYWKKISFITMRVVVANGVVVEHTATSDYGIEDMSTYEPGKSWVGEKAHGLGLVRNLGYKLIRSVSLSDYLAMVG
jgi:hypothetical protein